LAHIPTIATNKLPRRKKAIKPLLDWNLAELLRVAKAAEWLPSGLEYGKDDWDSRRPKIGDHAEVVRDIRTLHILPIMWKTLQKARHEEISRLRLKYPKPAKPEPNRDFERTRPSVVRAIFG
jgi:hypothetical protein